MVHREELAKARAKTEHLQATFALLIDRYPELLKEDYKEDLEIGARLIAALEVARAEVERLGEWPRQLARVTGLGIEATAEETANYYVETANLAVVLRSCLKAARAEVEKVIQLGKDFGFESLYGVSQVINHAEYLQKERARLLFENAKLEVRLPCGHREVDMDDSYGECVLCKYKNLYEEIEKELEAAEARIDELFQDKSKAIAQLEFANKRLEALAGKELT